MTEITITPGEARSGAMDLGKQAAAVKAVREDGFVILRDAVDLDHIAMLRDKMLADVDAYVSRPDAPFNFNSGNVQQEPPPFAPYLFQDVLFNPFVIAVTHAIFGDGVKNNFYSGNTALANSGSRQPVHADMGQLWPNLPLATPAYGLVVNVPVVEMTPENGVTELWPGTHTDTTIYVQKGDIKVPKDKLEARRTVSPPIQPVVPAGSILIRDIRLWHGGMPNHTGQHRPMIAMIHWAGWMDSGSPLVFPESERAFFQHPVLRTHATFTTEPIDYLQHGGAYEFSK